MPKAILKQDFEVRIDKKGEKVPRFKQGTEFFIIPMNMFWLKPEEKGGIGIDLAPMEYLRLTFPDGTKTKYYDLFEVKGEN